MKRHALMVLVIGWLVAAVALVAAADTPEQQAVKQDRQKYEGLWRAVALEVNGSKAAAQDAEKITVANHADETWAVMTDGKAFWKGSSTLHPTTKPKGIDFVPTEGTNVGQTYLGIYEIDGNTRRLCFAPPGKARPTEFASPPGSGHVLVVFRREKN
jgi:uncharacterized protein (TIGR03067 family)